MAKSHNAHELALVNPDGSPRKVTISSLLSNWLPHGPARSDDEIFAYINAHFDWSSLATVEEFIYQAKWSYVEDALRSTMTLTVPTQNGEFKKRQVRKYLKPTEFDADGNAEKRWKAAQQCTEKQLREVGATYVKQTMDLAEAGNAFNVHATKIVKEQRALKQTTQRALPPAPRKQKPAKVVPTPANQSYFTDFMEVATVNPDTGERHLRVKAEEVKMDVL